MVLTFENSIFIYMSWERLDARIINAHISLSKNGSSPWVQDKNDKPWNPHVFFFENPISHVLLVDCKWHVRGSSMAICVSKLMGLGY
jgi:hypothetical protein